MEPANSKFYVDGLLLVNLLLTCLVCYGLLIQVLCTLSQDHASHAKRLQLHYLHSLCCIVVPFAISDAPVSWRNH